MTKSVNNGILLESGTNELEIILFELGDETFAINVLKTREIITPIEITSIPKAPDYVEGVIHLRGELIAGVKLSVIGKKEDSVITEKDDCIIAQRSKIQMCIEEARAKSTTGELW